MSRPGQEGLLPEPKRLGDADQVDVGGDAIRWGAKLTGERVVPVVGRAHLQVDLQGGRTAELMSFWARREAWLEEMRPMMGHLAFDEALPGDVAA